MPSAISMRGLKVAYGSKTVVVDFDLEVAPGAWTTLIGPNGAGKTTALRALAGLVRFEGAASVGGIHVASASRRTLARNIAYVPQRPLLPVGISVTDYVLMGRNPYIGYLATEAREDLDIVADVLERLDLVTFADRPVDSLSGGEAQRVVLGRALAQRAPLLLLDEPTSELDVGHQQQVLELVDGLRREAGLTVLSTMHDLTVAGQYANDLVLLDRGRAVARGPADQVLRVDVIRAYYGASVEVFANSRGVVVAPVRPRVEEVKR
ncbi:MAG: ABC transporter ATP-binding protein [Actinomycetota bacterium]